MTQFIPKIAAFLALAGCAAITAQAAEITLYEHNGFGGRQVTLHEYTPSISNIGFNDKASSIVVRSGSWEVCNDNDFKGYCVILERGEYRQLDSRLNDHVSSVREAGTSAANTDTGNNTRRASIELFGRPGFKGKSVQLDRDSNNFQGSGFDDRASSVVVHNGTWVLCSDANYRGTCRSYAPGRYADLGYGMAKEISSARSMSNRYNERPVHRGGWDRRADNDDAMRVVLFSDTNLRGQSIALSDNAVDLSNTGFNDAAASMVVEGGFWEVCSDAYFRGQCRVIGPGQHRRLDAALHRSISSIRTATKEKIVGRPAANQNEVELFSTENFSGNRFLIRQDMKDFEQGGFNDRIASIVINVGQWELCLDSDFRGQCTIFGPGRYANLGGYTNRASSIRRID